MFVRVSMLFTFTEKLTLVIILIYYILSYMIMLRQYDSHVIISSFSSTGREREREREKVREACECDTSE